MGLGLAVGQVSRQVMSAHSTLTDNDETGQAKTAPRLVAPRMARTRTTENSVPWSALAYFFTPLSAGASVYGPARDGTTGKNFA